MTEKSVRYTPQFKRQMVVLVRSGRTPGSLSKPRAPWPPYLPSPHRLPAGSEPSAVMGIAQQVGSNPTP
jgi:hypothetical protein